MYNERTDEATEGDALDQYSGSVDVVEDDLSGGGLDDGVRMAPWINDWLH